MIQSSNRFPSLVAAIQRGESLHQGCSGDAVAQLQSCLNQIHPSLQLRSDGDFGPKTHQAVCAFQRDAQLRTDGVVGPITLQALLQALAPSAAPTAARVSQGPMPSGDGFVVRAGRVRGTFAPTPSGRLQQAEQILRAYALWPPESGRAYVIQIDQDSPPASASYADRQAFIHSYSGQMAVFYANAGMLCEQQSPLRSASHPGQFAAHNAQPPDGNGDGEPDIAWLRTGIYHYRSRPNDSGRYVAKDDREFAGVARDYTHDGVIDAQEAQQRHQAHAIQIHESGSAGPLSIGCQTLPKDEFTRLQQAIAQANRGGLSDFTYVLVRRPNDKFGSHEF